MKKDDFSFVSLCKKVKKNLQSAINNVIYSVLLLKFYFGNTLGQEKKLLSIVIV